MNFSSTGRRKRINLETRPMKKHQAPSTKLQTPQIPREKLSERVAFERYSLVLGIWTFPGAWRLMLGALSRFSGAWMLVLGAFSISVLGISSLHAPPAPIRL